MNPDARALGMDMDDATSVSAPSAVPDVRQLYADYGDRVFRWALRYGAGNAAWAEDITHDIFVRLLDRVPELHDADDLGGWFYRITANRCLGQLRRERRWRVLPIRWTRDFDADSPRTPEALATARTELREALAAIATLPPKQRVAFCMHHLDGLGQQEIGDVLGYSKSYVCKLLKRAAARLRSGGWSIDHA